MGLEIEHKLLLRRRPDEDELRAAGAFAAQIEQIYLTVPPGGGSRRVRREVDSRTGQVKRTLTAKVLVRPGVRDEREEAIDEQRYQELLSERDPASAPIRKTRWKLPTSQGLLEIDVFEDLDLSVVELELDDEALLQTTVELPPFLEVERDVTNDPEYTNAALARRLAAS